jgi:hypothetical protein
MDRIVKCPSGLEVKVGHLAAEYAGILTNRTALQNGLAADHILKHCTYELIERGPYSYHDRVDWKQALACDRTWALMEIWVATYGETYELELRCPACDNKFYWDLPLLQLERYELPEASREKISRGDNSFHAKLTTGERVDFRLMNGRDQVQALKLMREVGDDVFVAAMKTRVMHIEGVEDRELEGYIGKMSMGEIQTCIDQFDEHDGGVETETDVYCDKATCQFVWTVDVPLDLERMFTPKKPSRRRRRARRNQVQQEPTQPQSEEAAENR